MHGEVVDGGAASLGDIFGTGAGLSVEEGGGVADLDAFFRADFNDTVACGNGGDDRIEIGIDTDVRGQPSA